VSNSDISRKAHTSGVSKLNWVSLPRSPRRETPVVIEDRSQLMTFVLRRCGEVISSFLHILVTPKLLRTMHVRAVCFVTHCSGQGQTSIGYQPGSAAPL